MEISNYLATIVQIVCNVCNCVHLAKDNHKVVYNLQSLQQPYKVTIP